MMRFQHIEYFWLLLAIAVLVLLYMFHFKKRSKSIKQIGNFETIQGLLRGYSSRKNLFRFTTLMIGLFIGIIGLANLQKGSRTEKVERKGIDLIIALDVSKSMLAKDISPNRLEKAKQFISRLLEKVGNNRIGLIVFAGKSYISVPLTIDLSAFKMNLQTANPEMVPTQGTVISEAIAMARNSFNVKESKFKSMLIISDGEDHDEKAIDEVKKSVEEGIVVHTVGIGSPEGSPIWDEATKLNKRNDQGEEIISKLNEEELQNIATEGQGIYQRLTNTESTAEVVAKQINSSEQKTFGDVMFTDYNSYFQYFIFIALLLFIFEFFIAEQKKLGIA